MEIKYVSENGHVKAVLGGIESNAISGDVNDATTRLNALNKLRFATELHSNDLLRKLDEDITFLAIITKEMTKVVHEIRNQSADPE